MSGGLIVADESSILFLDHTADSTCSLYISLWQGGRQQRRGRRPGRGEGPRREEQVAAVPGDSAAASGPRPARDVS